VRATLGGVLEHLEILRVLLAPRGLEVDVAGVVVHDPIDTPRIDSGDVVLAVGIDVDRDDAVGLIEAAGVSSAVAVVVKLRDETTATARAEAAARQAGVALLAADRNVAWGHLYTLLRTATASLGIQSGLGPGGVAVGDLFTLANAVAAMVGGPTTIENPESTVLAYSSLDEPIDEPRQATILGRRVPAAWLRRLQEDGVFQRLWGGEDVVRIAYPGQGIRTRLAIAVRAGGQILGSIWVAEGRTPFGVEAEAALREAARIAALHLVRHQLGDDLDRRRGSELLHAALEGRRPPELLGELFGPARQRFVAVIGFEMHDADPADLAVQGERVVSLIELYAQAYRHQAVCTRIDRVVYLLVTDVTAPDPARLNRLATAIAEQSHESLRVGVHAGIGATVRGVEGLLASRHEADLVLRALAEQDAPVTVASLDAVNPLVVLLRLRDIVATEPSLLAGKLEVLARLDAKGHTSYLPTLRAYLDALGDIPTAAASLGVHRNTYRYRLRRLVTLAGLDMADPVERLVLHLQLHLRSAETDRRAGRTQPP
jgi:hypothetical protein